MVDTEGSLEVDRVITSVPRFARRALPVTPDGPHGCHPEDPLTGRDRSGGLVRTKKPEQKLSRSHLEDF